VTGGHRLARAGLLDALRCALRGQQWNSTPTSRGVVLVLCGRCRELVVAPFVDEVTVLGSPPPSGTSFLGATSACRTAVDLVAAVAAGDEMSWGRLRQEATARPGGSVDALASLAAVLSGMFDPRDRMRALWTVADAVERSVLEQELLEVSRRGEL
jgi:hypothetical protein